MQQQEKGFTERDSANILTALLLGQASTMTVFTRRDFGSEAFTAAGPLAFVVLWFWILGTQSNDMLGILVFWAGALFVQRLITFSNWRKGVVVHSRYCGYPWLTGWLCKDERVARGLEGSLIFVGGLCLADSDWTLSRFLMASGGAIVLVEVMCGEIDRKRRLALRDFQIEMQWLTNQLPTRGHGRG